MENKSQISKAVISAFLFAAFIIIIAGMKYASNLITPLLLALFISIICAQPMAWLARKKVSHGLSILIVLTGVNLILFLIGQLIGRSIGKFTKDAPYYASRLNEIATNTFQSLNEMGMNMSPDQLKSIFNVGKVMNTTAGMLGDLGGLMGNTVIVMFIVVFILMELNAFAVKTIAIVNTPNKSLNYLPKIGNSIRHYLGIKTLVSLATGVLIWIGLRLIGVEYAGVWAMIAFLMNFIPQIGSFLAMIPAILFALVQVGFGGALGTLITFVSVNLVMGSIVEPRVMGKGMGLSTLVVFISLIFWGFVFGTVGMFLSVPLTMAIKVILEQNENTRWIAILLGTQKEAEVVIERRKYAANLPDD